ncbi:MAG TPA: GGDEF domain-containing protein [Polyangiaceae bacterium]|nr:GGDEF domain-containing protein [Polyangiaceae bacterium]
MRARSPSRLEQQTLTNEVFSLRPAARERDRAVLVRMDSVQAGNVVSIDGPEIRIGRHPDNNAVVDDEGMSRSHARVFYQDGYYFAEDLDSSNGTYVNGERIDKAVLTDGAVIQLGPRVCFRFSLTDENQEKMLRQLYESSVRDALTGAYNRHFFLERLGAEVAYASRHSSHAAVIMFDVDHFKKVNDTYGHQAGDAVLMAIAGATSELLRQEDVFARYGGEEFVLLLRGVTRVGAERAGQRLLVAIEKLRIPYGEKLLNATVSVGCASMECTEQPTSEVLVALADRRLYAAKRAGRNRVVADG